VPDGLQEIVFVLVALAAVAIKAAIERKEAKRKRADRARRAPDGGAGERAEAGTGEVDLVVGRRPLPPNVEPRPRRRGRAPAAEPPPVPEPQAEPAVARGRPRSLGDLLTPTVSTDDIGDLEERQLQPKIDPHLVPLDVSTAMPGVARRGSRRALARLGVAGLESPRAMVRAGVLWSEVLGMPRAIKGPHRSPAARRASR
jgi:hypothetical protein